MQRNRIGGILTWVAAKLFLKGSLVSINAPKTKIKSNIQDFYIFIPQFEGRFR